MISRITTTDVETFARSYAALFASPDASKLDTVHALAVDIAAKYRPGMTFFTEGEIMHFENYKTAAQLIEHELRNNIKSGLGTHLELNAIESISIISDTAAQCSLRWTFIPGPTSEFAGSTWTFVNVYGYRAADDKNAAGWEYVVRDNEVGEMRKIVGMTFQ